jgi:hypothetical protein
MKKRKIRRRKKGNYFESLWNKPQRLGGEGDMD